jgi:DNA (cytosine-5)-methyltransferase 1
MNYFLDLFSGIGGFALGAYWAGLRFDAHYFSGVYHYACKGYATRFPEAKALGDIRAIRGSELPAGDWIIAGGFPCQDISVAGKGAGLAGERSGLWYEYARIIGELRPRFAIMENVGALAFRGLDSVLGGLAALGYDAEWQDIRASDVGAPHRRARLWIIAYPTGERWIRNTESEICKIGTGEARKAWNKSNDREDNISLLRRIYTDAQLADYERDNNGLPETMDRLHAVGNSIVPKIAELIFAREAFGEWRPA